MTRKDGNAIAALDVGYGQVKAMISRRPVAQNLETRHICFPRVIAAQQGKKWDSLRSAPVYSMEDEHYILGEDARAFRQHILSDQAKDYVGKTTYWLMIGKAFCDMNAFNGAGFSEGNHLHLKKIVLGLAPGHYTDEIETLLCQKIKEGFSFTKNELEFSIQADQVFLLPQGSGPYFANLLDERGKTRSDPRKRLSTQLYGIIDIGHETVDYVVFENKQYVKSKESPSEPNGIRYILEKLLEHVKDEYGYCDDKAEILRDVLLGETFMWRGKEHDLSKVVERLVRDHVRENITPNVMQRWQSFIGQMYRIFVCGGGAAVLERYVPDFLHEFKEQLVLCDQPAMANVAGFHRYALGRDFIDARNELRG